MKKYIILMLSFVLAFTKVSAQKNEWQADKYSMFIHFGLYSHFGGVYDGQPVRQGYSEQIQSFAGIFSDWYAEEARNFDPVEFDADEIARLAKAGGMRSIVFTSKHHDGFCMFDTKTTSYSSVAMMPSHRDFVNEMSLACRKHGLRFGLYFSLIDWNYPYAYPISSHNADFVTPEHHEFSKAQVRELLTNYGPISELWFDMGSLLPQQSRELYDLVKELQPECMVSGRLGNDVYDFAVMADNKLPESALQAPWQSAASMFPETWSYRSWQERGSVEDKYAEKLRTLINVVAHGGNYLLNIGPASDGSVVPFEDEVIRRIGGWLKVNGDAIYGTSTVPQGRFAPEYEWGVATVRDNVMYLLLTGEYPELDIELLADEGPLYVEGAKWYDYRGNTIIYTTPDMYSGPDVKVIKVVYDRPVDEIFTPFNLLDKSKFSWQNAVAQYSYSCFDYYSNYRSTAGYTWNVGLSRSISAVELTYTEEEIGREIRLSVGDMTMDVTLDGGEKITLSQDISIDSLRLGRMRGGTFDNAISMERVAEWTEIPDSSLQFDASAFSNYLMTGSIWLDKPSKVVFDVRSGNGMELMVDGKIMAKHLNPYRTTDRTEKLMLELSKGRHQIVLRSYNRFEDQVCIGLAIAENPKIYRMKVELPDKLDNKDVILSISPLDRPSPHTDSGLHNVILRLVRR